MNKIISKMTIEPAKIIRVNRGTLSIGAVADVAIIDVKKNWTVDVAKSKSKGRNCVFAGKKLTGKVIHTIVGGLVKMTNEELV